MGMPVWAGIAVWRISLYYVRAFSMCVMLVGVGLAVQVNHQQVSAKGLSQDLFVQDFRRFPKGN
jgi:hypothetical protein